MKNLVMMSCICASLLLAPSFAQAGGGGGAKKTSKVVVVNTFSSSIAFNVDDATAYATASALTSKGGRVATSNGNPQSISVTVGAHTVRGYVVGTGGSLGSATPFAITIPPGKIALITISSGGTPTVVYPTP